MTAVARHIHITLHRTTCGARSCAGSARGSKKTNEVVSGYMPVGRHYGFIYNQYDNARTLAHELAHGALSLSHTFSDGSESYLGEQGTTANLMDYNGGTHLNHLQWQWAHETHRNILGFLDDESEGELKNNKNGRILSLTLKSDGQIPLFDDHLGTEITGPNYEFDGNKKYTSAPFAILKGSTIRATLYFELNEQYTSDEVVVRGNVLSMNQEQNETQFLLPNTLAKKIIDNDKTFYQVEIECTEPMPNYVAYYKDFEIDWEVVDKNTGNGISIGKTKNKVMVMNVRYNSIDDYFKLYETIADIGCRNAHGKTSSEEIVESIWKDFVGLKMKNARGDKMFYWKKNIDDGGEAQKYQYLISKCNGTCRAWAHLLFCTLIYQGVNNVAVYHIQSINFGNGEQLATTCFNSAYLNKEYTKEEENAVCTLGCKGGQNNDNVSCVFKNHYVVVWNGYLYDPSYGGKYLHDVSSAGSIESDWEKSNIGAFIMVKPNNGMHYARPNIQGKPEVEFGKATSN